MFGGVILRLQLAGAASFLETLDIRRSHSHLGFYGFLFPMLWSYIKESSDWVPGNKIKFFYVMLLVTSSISFAVSGYNVISHIASFIILLFWIYFATRMLRTREGFLKAVPISIYLSAVAVFSIMGSIYLYGDSAPRFELARLFLIVLLFGVFGSLIIHKIAIRPPNILFWLAGATGSAVALSGLVRSEWILLFPLMWGVGILYFVFNFSLNLKNDAERLRKYFVGIGVILILVGVSVLNLNSLVAVAGIHYFIFLCCGSFFLKFKAPLGLYLFEALSLIMCSLILLSSVGIYSLFLMHLLSLVSVALFLISLWSVNIKNVTT